MDNPGKINFSDFAADPEFESIYEFDELYNLDFSKNPDKSQEDPDYDDADEFIWDDL